MSVVLNTRNILCALSLIFFHIEAYSQTYKIQSLEGKWQRITIVNDYNNNRLQIICFKDTICVYGNWYGDVNVETVDKNFLKIHYSLRAGSGASQKNLLFVCVKDKKLYVPLHILAQSLGYSGNGLLEEGLAFSYQVKTAINQHGNTGPIKLTLELHKALKTKDYPKKEWFNYHKKVVLHFDKQNNIFYNTKEHLNKSVAIYNMANDSESMFDLKGELFAVVIDDSKYYYTHNNWYTMGKNAIDGREVLTQYISRCK